MDPPLQQPDPCMHLTTQLSSTPAGRNAGEARQTELRNRTLTMVVMERLEIPTLNRIILHR
jgi:hypothetical protein